MKLYLARHGRTNYNELELCNYDPTVDVHLTPVGIEQAKALADTFKQLPIDHIFVSELARTQQTEIINAFHNLKVVVDVRLNDIISGFEGKPFAAYQAALAAAPDRWTARFIDSGESIEDVKKRVADFIGELRTKKYDSVLIITSQWIIYAIAVLLQGLSNEEAWNLELEQGNHMELDI